MGALVADAVAAACCCFLYDDAISRSECTVDIAVLRIGDIDGDALDEPPS